MGSLRDHEGLPWETIYHRMRLRALAAEAALDRMRVAIATGVASCGSSGEDREDDTGFCPGGKL